MHQRLFLRNSGLQCLVNIPPLRDALLADDSWEPGWGPCDWSRRTFLSFLGREIASWWWPLAHHGPPKDGVSHYVTLLAATSSPLCRWIIIYIYILLQNHIFNLGVRVAIRISLLERDLPVVIPRLIQNAILNHVSSCLICFHHQPDMMTET